MADDNSRLASEFFKGLAGVDYVHVPYKGAAPSMSALMGGEADFSITDPVASINAAKSGKVRLIAVTSAQRSKAFPQLPTVAESGVPGYIVGTWGGMLAPAGTPAPIVAKLNADAGPALAEPDVVAKFECIELEIRAGPLPHAALGRTVLKRFTAGRIDAVQPGIRAHANRPLAELGRRGGGDLVADLGRPLLYGALGRMLGFDEEAAQRGSELMVGLFHSTEGPMGSPLPGTMAPDVRNFLDAELRKRKNSRGDDLFSVLIAAREQGANLSEEEIVANMMTVLLAGGASINHFFSNLMYALWLHPESRKAVREDLGLIDAAVEEGVRWDTSTQCFARHLTAEVTVAGVALPAQSRAILFYGSANRDERAIADASRFDIHRPRVRHVGS